MQPIVRAFVEDALETLAPPDPVVEFGALQVEDDQAAVADLRPLFAGRDFTGTDFRPGPGVDRVEDLRGLTYADESIGTAICLETLEHCEDPLTACRELARVVKPGGVCLVSTPFLLGIHGYPNDYFRFTPEAMRSMLSGFDDVWSTGAGDEGAPLWVFAVAAKGRDLDLTPERMPRLTAAQEKWDRAAGRIRIGPLQFGTKDLAKMLGKEMTRLAREKVRHR